MHIAARKEPWPFVIHPDEVSSLGKVFGIVFWFFLLLSLCSEVLLQVCYRLDFSL